MASAQQIFANTQNGRLGAGHKTEEGKATSARNATRHGLTSKEVVLANESQSEFDELLRDYIRQYVPSTPERRFLVLQLAESDWRLRRARRLETKFFNQHSEDEILNDKDVAAALTRLTRYESSIERAYYKALKEVKSEMKAVAADSLAALEKFIASPPPNTKRSETWFGLSEHRTDSSLGLGTCSPAPRKTEVP
jgi:hypothetical protein